MDKLMFCALRAKHFDILHQHLLKAPTKLSFFPMPLVKNEHPALQNGTISAEALDKQFQVFVHFITFYDPCFVTDQQQPSLPSNPPRPSTNSQSKLTVCTIYDT
jgi:hypothetical protein